MGRSDWITPSSSSSPSSMVGQDRKEGRREVGGNEALAPSLPRDGDDDEVFKA